MKVLNIIGLVLSISTFASGDPTCTYTMVDSKYTCLMQNSKAGTTSTIAGNHTSSNDNTKVIRVTTTDEADINLIKLLFGSNGFSSIEELQIQKGGISTLSIDNPFSNPKCATLKQLQLLNGAMTAAAIPADTFDKCTGLQEIDLSGNNLGKLSKEAFSGINSNIKKLVLTNTKLLPTSTVFEASSLPELLHLNVSGNGITTIPETSFKLPSTKLTHLDFSNNQMTSFPESLLKTATLPNLEVFNLHMNNLASITATQFKELTKLKELRIGSNQIVEIKENAFASNTNLELLDISKNPLKILKSAELKVLTNLKSLDLQDIQINSTSMEPLKEVLTALTNLVTLNISSNNIGSINGLFTNSANLINLSINSMQLGTLSNEIFNSLTKLENLNFNANNITEIPENIFAKTISMKSISVQNNKIASLKTSTFEKMTKLQVLDFTGNEINAIERTFFDKLTELKVVKFGGTNKCYNKDFLIFNLTDVKEKLEPCFVNYNGAQAIIISNLMLALVTFLKFI